MNDLIRVGDQYNDIELLKRNLPKIQLIGAMGANGVIGDSKSDKLPWADDKSLKWDMDNFKTLTMYSPIIMGYKTALTFKKPLNGRYNIVINSRQGISLLDSVDGRMIDRHYDVLDNIGFLSPTQKFIEVPSLEFAIKIVLLSNLFFEYEFEKCFIIGGAKTYKEALEKEYPSSLILTSFDDSFEGDVLFPTKLCKENETKYRVYQSDDFHNGNITYHEIIDPEWEERVIKNVLLTEFQRIRNGIKNEE